MTLDQYISRIALGAPGCSYPLMEQALYDSAEMFCQRSRVLSEVNVINVTPGQATYSLDFGGSTRVHDLDNVTLDGFRLDAYRRGADAEPGVVLWYEIIDDEITLIGTPANPGTLSIGVVLVPKTSGNLPAALDRWREGIVAGALFRLLKMPGHAWSNGQAAAENWQLYESEIRTAVAASVLPSGKRQLRVAGAF